MLILIPGCRQREDLASLSPDIKSTADRYGPAAALAMAQDRADKEPTARNYERLAQVYTLTEQLDEAIKALQKALELDPDYPRAVIGMSIVKLRQNRPAEAQELAERLLDDKFAGPQEAQVTLIRALLGQQKAKQAYGTSQMAVKQHRDYGPLYYALGDSALAVGKVAEGESAYREAINIDPGERRYRQALIVALVRAKKIDEAVEMAQQTQEQYPESPTIQFIAGSVYSQAGNTKAAIKAYEEALLLRPDMAPAANNLALTLAERGEQLTRAQELASKALRQDPNNNAYADTLAWTWIRAGKYADGIKLLETVVKYWPESPAPRYHLGYALVKTGKTERGKALLKQAAAADDRPDVANAAKEVLAGL